MKKWIAAPAMAGLLLVGTASVADAAAPAQAEVSDDDSSNAGLFGLIGLAGLAGLAGLKRRNTNDGGYDQRSGGASRTP